ncbi:carbohydrate ABC transporter permease [Lachnoclostridium sp. Marseille-P6806]|uniref:carbohydrate ABC transporter permease n=1 Tax=Lachnoclostridium sp. Marseille-P6806 TaxID=2364793 RepID=UPI001030C56A|nr:carbohydrate ABC transporter permease [Lachnoclostridium sp. Marseille-P6806]
MTRNSYQDLASSAPEKIRLSASSKLFYVICYLAVILIAAVCLVPFMLLLSGSFTAEQWIRFHGFGLFPGEFSLEAYQIIFKTPERILRAYGVSIFITAVGTGTGLILTTLTAYVISRKDFRYRNVLSFFFYFTTLFNGGMVSTYIFYIQYLHLKDNLLALILPGMFNVFYLLIMRTFVNTVPVALIESAKLDGAGEWRTFLQIVLPLLKPGLATIGLFLALGYWNDWYNAMLYLNSEDLYPLQYMLYAIQQQTQALAKIASQAGIQVANLPSNSLKLAMAVVATGPIVVVYPFVQKYFIAGITIGSVKG